jgi:hypothetical protein
LTAVSCQGFRSVNFELPVATVVLVLPAGAAHRTVPAIRPTANSHILPPS